MLEAGAELSDADLGIKFMEKFDNNGPITS
jgi:hypothetical protein